MLTNTNHLYNRNNNMKKILFLALLIVMGATINTTEAKKKKDKKQTPTPVVLSTLQDSVSYAFGVEMTNGLIPYLKSQRGVENA